MLPTLFSSANCGRWIRAIASAAVALFLILPLAPGAVLSGPPFKTDDPEPWRPGIGSFISLHSTKTAVPAIRQPRRTSRSITAHSPTLKSI